MVKINPKSQALFLHGWSLCACRTFERSLGLDQEDAWKTRWNCVGVIAWCCQRRRNADVGERVIQLFPEMQLSHLRYMQIWEGGMILQRWGSVVSLKPLAVTGLTLELVFMNFMLVTAYIIIRRTYTNCWMRRWREKVTFQIYIGCI